MKNNKGWKNEPTRHGLASKGIKTTNKNLKRTKYEGNYVPKEFLKNVKKIKIPIQDIWEVWFYNHALNKQGEYVIKVASGQGGWDEVEEGKKEFSEFGSYYPSDMKQKPVHIGMRDLVEIRDLSAHPDILFDYYEEFKKEMDYQGIKKGSQDWKEAKEEFLYQTKLEMFSEFKSKLKDKLKVDGKSIDVEYVGDIDFDVESLRKP